MPFERPQPGDRCKAYIVEVRRTAKGPQIVVSRTHPGLIKRLFELEVPEIADGIVEIKACAREPGHRTKLAVWSNDHNVDPVGACVGARGGRVRMVVNELRGEKIDIVPFSDDLADFVAKALSPAKVSQVLISDDATQADVIVPDHQLSLAIGREGQNARLAARLTGVRIDIRSETQLAEGVPARRDEEEVEYAEGQWVTNAETGEHGVARSRRHDHQRDRVERAGRQAEADQTGADQTGADRRRTPTRRVRDQHGAEQTVAEQTVAEQTVAEASPADEAGSDAEQPAAETSETETSDTETSDTERPRPATPRPATPKPAKPRPGRPTPSCRRQSPRTHRASGLTRSDANVPVRTCVGCRRRRPQHDLVRCVLTGAGEPVVSRTAPGRGAWLCVPPVPCFELAVRRKAFDRAWRRHVGTDVLAGLRSLLESAAAVGWDEMTRKVE